MTTPHNPIHQPTPPDHELSYRALLSQTWPIILANLTTPLVGIADTIIIGHTGNTQELGALALGALIFSLLYWSFGFLKMGTTGFIAQARGRNNPQEMTEILIRALLLSLTISTALLTLQLPIGSLIFYLFNASDNVESFAKHYFTYRILGAPFTLCIYVFMGMLVGLRENKILLLLQLILNISNIIFSIVLTTLLGLGVQGIALGTVFAELLTFIIGIGIFLRHPKIPATLNQIRWHRVFSKSQLRQLFQTNSNIMMRTFFLIGSFAWFNNMSAKMSDLTLAANHILLQYIAFSAFFLDGFAHVTESNIGEAYGKKSPTIWKVTITRTSQLAAITALCLSLAIGLLGQFVTPYLTDIESVISMSNSLLPWCAIYIFCAFPAFQLDGIFIGALATKQLRNAAIFSSAFFFAVSTFFVQTWGNHGLWWSFILYVVMRGVTLLYYYRDITPKNPPAKQPSF